MAKININGFSTAVSGLKAQQDKLVLIGSNIANMNTIGFKAKRMTFAEQLGQTVGVNYTAYSQGSFQTTGNASDLAISGDSFFIIKDGTSQVYTRAGNFHFNDQGVLANPDGLSVLGWMTGNSQLGNVTLDEDMVSAAQATTNLYLTGNLNAGLTPVQEVWTAQSGYTIADGSAATAATLINDISQVTTSLVAGDEIAISGKTADGTSVSATYTYAADDTVQDLLDDINTAFGSGTSTGSTATIGSDGKVVLTDNTGGDSSATISLGAVVGTGEMTVPTFLNTAAGSTPTVTFSMIVYDARGGAHEISTDVEKSATDNTWDVTFSAAGDETITAGSTGTLTFTDDGLNPNFVFDNNASGITMNPNNGSPSLSLALDINGTDSFAGLTQFTSVSDITLRDQDGRESGALTGFTVEEDGKLNAAFDNGEILEIAQLGVAKFTNASGLEIQSNGLLVDTLDSGEPRVGKADEQDSLIQSGVLELSNVDLAEQFTKMIEAQRTYQAVSKVLTTIDEVMAETSRLKR